MERGGYRNDTHPNNRAGDRNDNYTFWIPLLLSLQAAFRRADVIVLQYLYAQYLPLRIIYFLFLQ